MTGYAPRTPTAMFEDFACFRRDGPFLSSVALYIELAGSCNQSILFLDTFLFGSVR